jgi:hypothetical protein
LTLLEGALLSLCGLFKSEPNRYAPFSAPRSLWTSYYFQLLNEFLGLDEIGCIEALGKPAIDRSQKVLCFAPSSLVSPHASEAGCGAQLPQLRIMLACNGQGAVEAGFGPVVIRLKEGQQQLPRTRCTSASFQRVCV